MAGKLKPSTSDKIVRGVCGGLAEHFGWDVTPVRIVFAVASVLGVGSPVLVYLIMWAVMRYQ